MRLKRNLLDAAMSNGIPLLAVLLMLFAILVTSTRDTDRSMLLGFNPSGVMRIISAFFFIVLLAHIHLRNTIQAQEVVFIEYLYFTAYLAIVLTSLHAFLFSLKVDIWVIDYKDSLIVKLCYWPVLLGLQFAVTMVLFY